MVRVSDLQPRGHRFESWPLRFTYNPGKVIHIRAPLSTSSINWYRRKLGAKPRVRGLVASAGVWLRAIEMEISAALWALVARERL